jgi:hypothetical protein
MKILSLFSFYFLLSTQAQASLEGDYQLIKGPTLCPIGSISLKPDIKDKTRTLLFGSQLSWVLNMEDKSVVKEVVEAGCTYTTAYEKTDNTFKVKTTRSSCPKIPENGVITEMMELKNDKLNYQYEFTSEQNKKTNYNCFYIIRK